MNLKVIGHGFKVIGKGVLGVADAGHALGIPVLSQIDTAADALAAVKGKSKAHDAQIAAALEALKAAKELAPASVQAKGQSLVDSVLVSGKTTLAGFGLVATGLAQIANGLATGAPVQWEVSLGAIISGIGLIAAKDANVGSKQ